MLTRQEVETCLLDWGRWLADTEDCYPDKAGCQSLESGYRSPQRWTDEHGIFVTDPDPQRAEIVERVATSGVLTWREKRVLDTHYVRLPWWRLMDWGIPQPDWTRRRVRYSRANGIADYSETLDTCLDILARELAQHRRTLFRADILPTCIDYSVVVR